MLNKFLLGAFLTFSHCLFHVAFGSAVDEARLKVFDDCDLTPLATSPNEKDPSKPTIAYAALLLEKFKDIDDIQQTLSIIASLQFTFRVDCIANQTRLYNATPPYSPIAKHWNIFSGLDQFWRPPVSHVNSHEDYSMSASINNNIAIEPFEGLVTYVYTGPFTAECSLDLTLFPFDRQVCGYEFALWQSAQWVKVESAVVEKPEPTFQKPNSGWDIDKITSNYSYVLYDVERELGNYIFSFEFHLTRRVNYFMFNLIAPCLVLSVVQLALFAMPFGCTERASFAITILLAFSVAQGSVIANVPKTSETLLLMICVSCDSYSSLAVTFYAAATSGLFESFSKRFGKKISFFGKTITRGRLFDLIAFFITLAYLIAVNIGVMLIMVHSH